MDTNRITSAFLGLTRQEKIETLVRLSHELTMVGRETYQAGSTGLLHPARLRTLNEVQHRVSGHLVALLRNEPGYPDEVLVKIIVGQDDDPELQRQIQQAFSRVLAQQPVSG